MESGEERSERVSERHLVVLKDASWFAQFRNGSNPWMARYMYSLFFLLSNLLAWAARDYIGHRFFALAARLNMCADEFECSGAEGVLRVSLGCFMFFLVMLFTTTGTSTSRDPRDYWHSGWWLPKIMLWIGLTVLAFFVPSSYIDVYGEVAHFGAGVFLLIQLVSIVSFINWINDCCNSEKNVERCHVHVMIVATTSYVVCIGGIIAMYIMHASSSSCLINVFFITWTLVLLQIMTSLSLHPKINGGILAPGLMGLYVVYMCWSAIRSEPAGSSCNKRAESSKGNDWLTIISFIVALLAIVIATFSTGIDSACFQIGEREKEKEGDVPYNYSFFHLVFATGAMYFAMLLIGWNSHQSLKKWTIDVGWTSTWVRIINEWLAVCIYLWMLVAPIIWKNAKDEEPMSSV